MEEEEEEEEDTPRHPKQGGSRVYLHWCWCPGMYGLGEGRDVAGQAMRIVGAMDPDHTRLIHTQNDVLIECPCIRNDDDSGNGGGASHHDDE